MKKTTLYTNHLALNAKMTPFGGYEMPVQYEGVTKEHLTVRESVGVFDVSHMGEFYVYGPHALALLQHLCSNDISKIDVGKAQYNCFPNLTGGIVDDLIVYRVADTHYLLVVNASNIDKDWQWVESHNKSFGASIVNVSDRMTLLAIQGPKAIEAMQSITNVALAEIPYYAHTSGNFAGIENVVIATTGYTGAGGIEIYIPADKAPLVWDAVLSAGHSFGIAPIGLAARDTLRLEMGFCLYGNEINDTTSPISAGLGWITKPEAGCINAAQFQKEKKEGTLHKLVGFELLDRGIPRSGYTLANTEGKPIGTVTSGTQSPILSKGIGLGYVESSYAQTGNHIAVIIRDKLCSAQIVKPPFIQN